MVEALCRLIQNYHCYLNLAIGYTKVCDWIVEVEQRVEIGKAKSIVYAQDCDLNRACAEAYLKTTEWLCVNKGGY